MAYTICPCHSDTQAYFISQPFHFHYEVSSLSSEHALNTQSCSMKFSIQNCYYDQVAHQLGWYRMQVVFTNLTTNSGYPASGLWWMSCVRQLVTDQGFNLRFKYHVPIVNFHVLLHVHNCPTLPIIFNLWFKGLSLCCNDLIKGCIYLLFLFNYRCCFRYKL